MRGDKMRLDSKTFERWKDWCKQIENDLTKLLHYKQIHDYFFGIVNANLDHIEANEGRLFCDFVRECYGYQAAVGIRRHIRSNRDSISLMRLLEQIRESADNFTYDFYLENYPIVDSEWQRSAFNEFSDDGNVISRSKVECDINKLRDVGDVVANIVDRVIAHLDKRGCPVNGTYNDLADSLDCLNKVTCKYSTLLTSESTISITPAIQFDWEKIFIVPFDVRKNNNLSGFPPARE